MDLSRRDFLGASTSAAAGTALGGLVGLVLLLGAPGQPTLEVEIWRQASVMLDLPAAATLAVIQIVGVVGLLVMNARWQERSAVAQRLRPAVEVARPPRTTRERLAVGAIALGLGVCIGGPLVALVEL